VSTEEPEPELAAGAGAGDFSLSTAVAGGAATDVVEGLGVRSETGPGAPAGVKDNPQLEAEGAETLQAAGRAVALVTFKTTPKEALLLKASQRHSASAFNTVLRPAQQVPSGFVTVLPFVT